MSREMVRSRKIVMDYLKWKPSQCAMSRPVLMQCNNSSAFCVILYQLKDTFLRHRPMIWTLGTSVVQCIRWQIGLFQL